MMEFKYTEYQDSSMSSLYFWGKPIANRLFQTLSNTTGKVTFQQPIQELVCGERHCAFVAEGAAFGFGDNSEGQLGETQEGERAIVPLLLGRTVTVKEVACGWTHTLVLDEDGVVYSAGRADHGELGRGKPAASGGFEVVLKGVRQISAGKDHSLALCGSKVFGWGNSREGQLGLLARKIYYYPHQLNVYPANCIFAGAKYSLFITSKGVYGTGINQNCQLGLGHEAEVHVPRRLAIQEEVVALAGGNYCAAKTANNQWFLWGSGGLGVFKYPTKMSFLKGAEEIAMGLHFGLLSREGQVMVWGSNRWGELGDGDESRDFAVEAEEMCELELTGLAAGSNYVVGFRNYKNEQQESFSNPLKDSHPQSNQEGNSSISRELFKHFKRSSPSNSNSGNSLPDQPETAWAKFYQIRHNYDIVADSSQQLPFTQPNFSTKQPILDHVPSQKTNLEQAGYMTWQYGYPRKVNLSKSLKTLLHHQASLQKQNKTLKQRLHEERCEKERTRAYYTSTMNLEEDRRILSRILKLQEKISGGTMARKLKEQQKNSADFSKKLHSLKKLLQSAL